MSAHGVRCDNLHVEVCGSLYLCSHERYQLLASLEVLHDLTQRNNGPKILCWIHLGQIVLSGFTVRIQVRHVLLAKALLISRAQVIQRGNLGSGTEGRQVFWGITTEAGHLQAKSIHRPPGRECWNVQYNNEQQSGE